VIVRDFYITGIPIQPDKTYPPQVINTDTVLAFPIMFKGFEAVGRRNSEIGEGMRVVDQPYFPFRGILDLGWQSP
jgi:hypothetical protein